MSNGIVRHVLLIEDAAADARLTIENLKDAAVLEAFEVMHVQTTGEARRVLANATFDIILLDLNLPDASGLEAVFEIQHAAPELPLVVLSGLDDERLALEAVLNGAQDYLIKGEAEPALLRRAVRHAIERKRVERDLSRLAKYDPLTGLANRALFRDRLAEALHRAQRTGRLVAVMFVDLDRFKEVNDQHGHAAGDRVLQETAERLRRLVRRTDTVARLGGDEFTIVLQGLHGEADLRAVADKVLRGLNAPIEHEGLLLHVGASVGATVMRDADEPPEALIERADIAMYRAKAAGGARCQVNLPYVVWGQPTGLRVSAA